MFYAFRYDYAVFEYEVTYATFMGKAGRYQGQEYTQAHSEIEDN